MNPAAASTTSLRRRANPWPVAACVFFGHLAIYAAFFHARDWNTASRFLLTYAVVDTGGIEITPFVAWHGMVSPHPPTRDLASPDRARYYCDKAPGQSFIGIPVYAAARRLGWVGPYPRCDERGGPNPETVSNWPADYLVTLGSSGVLGAATATLIVLILHHFGASHAVGVASALGFGLATPAFAYATLNYGHVAAGFWSLLAVWLALGSAPAAKGILACLLAGTAAGMAVMTEYTLAIVPVVVGLLLLVQPGAKRWRDTVALLVGGLPMALALGWYHLAVTGDPFVPAYRYEVNPEFAIHRQGAGIPLSLPDRRAVVAMTVGFERGLLWFAPMVLLSLPGCWWMARRGHGRLAAAIMVTAFGLLALIAGFPNWDGGLATGPRFLVAALPLLAVAAGYGLVHLGRAGWAIWGVLTIPSAIAMSLLTAGGRSLGDLSIGRQLQAAVDNSEPHLGVWIAQLFGQIQAWRHVELAILLAFVAAVATVLLAVARRRDRMTPG